MLIGAGVPVALGQTEVDDVDVPSLFLHPHPQITAARRRFAVGWDVLDLGKMSYNWE